MKLSDYAKSKSISYRTAHRHWQLGYLQGEQLPSGTIVVYEEEDIHYEIEKKAILYARVSSSENKTNLEAQLVRLRNYASAKGYTIIREIKEIGSGLNDHRQQLEKILQDDSWNILIVEYKDRLARFGLNYLSILLNKQNKNIEVINETFGEKEDLMQDFVSIITSFTARLYGLRRSKRKTEEIIKQLKETK
jgi:predicted site-specific integrase-resolvase